MIERELNVSIRVWLLITSISWVVCLFVQHCHSLIVVIVIFVMDDDSVELRLRVLVDEMSERAANGGHIDVVIC